MLGFGPVFSMVDLVGYGASSGARYLLYANDDAARCVAIGSNILYDVWFFAHIYPVMLLHAVLLPVNVTRLVQIRRLIRDA